MRRPLRVAARIAFGAVLAVAAAGVVGPGCRTATQVTVELRTSDLTCADLRGVAIVVAGSSREAEDKMALETFSALLARGDCGADPHLLGTLVVTPSSGTGAVIVRARVRDTADATCKPPDYKGCIVARRAFSFVDHTAVTLPITLERACADVPCDAITSCRTGTCVSSRADCSQELPECKSEAQPVIGADGGAIPPDASGESAASDSSFADRSVAPDAQDGAVDSAVEAEAEAGNPLGGNLCPTASGDIDCATLGQVCCLSRSMMSAFTCAPLAACPTASNFQFPCTGTKHCPAPSVCCGDFSVGSYCKPPGSVGACSGILCSVDGDCLSQQCRGPGPSTMGGKVIHTCM